MLQTADVDVNPEELVENVDVDAALATTAACGSSFCSSAAADAAVTSAADAATTAACGSSFCSSAVADVAATSAADAATTAACGSSFCSSAVAEWAMDAAVSTADASMKIEGGGVYHSVLFIL